MTLCTKCGVDLDDPHAHRDHSPRCSDESACTVRVLREQLANERAASRALAAGANALRAERDEARRTVETLRNAPMPWGDAMSAKDDRGIVAAVEEYADMIECAWETPKEEREAVYDALFAAIDAHHVERDHLLAIADQMHAAFVEFAREHQCCGAGPTLDAYALHRGLPK